MLIIIINNYKILLTYRYYILYLYYLETLRTFGTYILQSDKSKNFRICLLKYPTV